MKKSFFTTVLAVQLAQINTTYAAEQNVSDWDDLKSVIANSSVNKITVTAPISANSEFLYTLGRNLTITGGDSVQSISGIGNQMHFLVRNQAGTLTLENISFDNFTPYSHLGALDVSKSASIILNNTTIKNFSTAETSSTDLYGGALNINDGSYGELNNSTIRNNVFYTTATDTSWGVATGGAVHVQGKISTGSGNYDPSHIKIENTDISGNGIVASAATTWGGALYLEGVADAIKGSTFSQNFSKATAEDKNAYGGAIAIGGANNNRGTAMIESIENTTFSNNKALSEKGSSFGGAIFVSAEGLIKNISDTTFTGNTAQNGGAVYNLGQINNLINSSFTTATDTLVNAENASIGTVTNINMQAEMTNAGTISEIITANAGTNYIKSLTNSGTIGNITGSTTLGYLLNSGTITASSDDLVIENGFGNTSGGTVNNQFLTVKGGDSVNNGTITGTLKFLSENSDASLNNTNKIETIADSQMSALTNSGTIGNITGSTTLGYLLNSGTITASSDDLVIENGFGNTSGGTINSQVLTVKGGDSVNNGTITGALKFLSENSDASLNNTNKIETIADSKMSALTNSGTIDRISNTALQGVLQNSGKINVSSTDAGATNLSASDIINAGELTFSNVNYSGLLHNYKELTVNGNSSLTGNITNQTNAVINLSDVTAVTGNLENNGITYAKGTLSASDIVNNGNLDFNNTVYTGNMHNNSILNVSGNNEITSDVFANDSLVTVNNGASLNILNGLNNSLLILNNGNLTIAGNSQNSGVIKGDVTIGNGQTSSFNNSGSVIGKVFIADNATLNSALSGLKDIDIAQNGILNINEDSILNQNITGSGTTKINSKLYFGRGLLSSTGALTVTESGELDLQDKNITVGSLNLDGKLNFGISSISADSAIYDGGKITVADSAVIGNNAKLALTVAPDLLQKGEKTDELKLIDGQNISGTFNNIANNNRYEITAGTTDGSIIIKSIAGGGDIAETVGNRNNRNTAIAWDSVNVQPDSDAAKIKDILNTLSQHDAEGYVRALTEVAPTDSRLALMTTRELNDQITRSVRHRFYQDKRTCGNPFAQSSVWFEGLGNYSHQNNRFESAGFNARTAGYMLGADATINCETTAGIGYAYNYTKASSQGRDTDIKGHTVFTYAKYQPEAAYLRGGLSYGYSDYSEKSNVENVALSSKYNIHAVSSEIATGYEFQDGFIPEAGLRYTYLNPESYTDSLGQKINPDNSHLLTAAVALHFRPKCGDVWYNIRPNGYIGLTYDIYSPNTATNVVIADNHYQISSERTARLGAEGGIGVEFLTENWDFSIGYDLGIKEDYQSHTGMFKARYNF